MTQKVTIGRSRRLIVATALVAIAGVLSGCGGGGMSGFDPSDLFDFLDTKKKLPGDRKPVFPEGVPGLEQGVPKDLYRGARASANTAAPEPPPPPPVAEPPKRRTAATPRRQPVQQEPPDGDAAAAEEGVAATPPAPPPPRRRAVQQQQPQAQQQPVQQQSSAPPPFPAPLPSGSFSR